jgi:uncharacterized Rossmann fold enzyme
LNCQENTNKRKKLTHKISQTTSKKMELKKKYRNKNIKIKKLGLANRNLLRFLIRELFINSNQSLL